MIDALISLWMPSCDCAAFAPSAALQYPSPSPEIPHTCLVFLIGFHSNCFIAKVFRLCPALRTRIPVQLSFALARELCHCVWNLCVCVCVWNVCSIVASAPETSTTFLTFATAAH